MASLTLCCYAGVSGGPARVPSVLPQVSCMAWRAGWRTVEPKPPVGGVHNYKWAEIDAAVAATAAAGKTSTIRVMGGQFTPAWVQPQLTYNNVKGNRFTEPIVWDTSYLAPFCQLIAALCQRYGSDERVAWIVMSGCGMNDEMTIGWSAPDNIWQSTLDPPNGCGGNPYSARGLINGWNQCIDTYRANLPASMPSALCFDLPGLWPGVHNPMFTGTEGPAIIAHAQTYGRLVMLQNNGLNATFNTNAAGKSYESKVYNQIVTNNSSTKVGWQTTKDGTSVADMQACLNIATGSGASYVEIWPDDCANAALVPAYNSIVA